MTVPNRPQPSPTEKGTVPRPPIGGTVQNDGHRPQDEKGDGPACLVCQHPLTQHETQTCENCLTNARTLISGIVTMYSELDSHLPQPRAVRYGHTRGGGDGKPLPGGDLLVLIAAGSRGRPDHDPKEREQVTKSGDPQSVAYTLLSWALDWQETRDESEPLGQGPATQVLRAGGYLERRCRWAATSHPLFDWFHDDLQQLHSRLERATSRDLPVEQANARCFACSGRLVRHYDPATGLPSEEVRCTTRGCGERYDPVRYQFALTAAYRALEEWVLLTDAARAVRRSVETVETWAKRGQVRTDYRSDGRKLVWWPDLQSKVGA